MITDLFPPHPVLEPPTAAELAVMTPETVQDLVKLWGESIDAAKRDPLRSGHVPQMWRDMKRLLDEGADNVVAFGGNRSSKTTGAVWLVVQALLNNPGTLILAWAQSEAISILVQQSAVYNMLPPEYRRKDTTGNTKIHYKLSTGFTGNMVILPNGSQLHFRFYSQFTQDPSCVEGVELGWAGGYGEESPFTNVGCWFDEYLIAPALMRTMEERLSTRNAKGLSTFTPINQYTETVEEILDGAETIESEVTRDDDPEQIRGLSVPYIQRQGSKAIIYFATRKNKFHNYARSCRNMAGKPRSWVLMKLYGVPSKISSAKFPKFSRKVNVIDALPGGRYTRYEVTDPAGDKPWFKIWVAVNAEGEHYVYREWPCFDDWGAWAERRDGKWVPGEAATGECCGLGYDSYKEIVEELEEGEQIYERFIDPRMGASSVPGKEHSTTIIAEMAEIGLDYLPAPGVTEQEGIQCIQELMDYDMTKPLSALNKPKFYVHEDCGNVIRSFSGYDSPAGRVDLKHPWKDPVDCVRYMAVSDLEHAELSAMAGRPGGGY